MNKIQGSQSFWTIDLGSKSGYCYMNRILALLPI